PQAGAARRPRRDLHRDGAPVQRGDVELRAQHGLGHRDGHFENDVVAFAAEVGGRRDLEPDDQVSPARPLAGGPHLPALLAAGWHFKVDLPAVDVEGHLAALGSRLERDGDIALDLRGATRPARAPAAGAAAEDLAEVFRARPAARAPHAAELAEDAGEILRV